MKRILALLTALCLLLCALPVLAEETVELSQDGVTVTRIHLVEQTDRQRIAVDYPSFACEDPQLETLLNAQVAAPIRERCSMAEQADASVYEDGAMDTITSGYCVSMDFPGLLSVEASFRYESAGSNVVQIDFFSRIISLEEKRAVTLYDLFNENPETVDASIRNAVFMQGIAGGFLKETITDSADIPLPNTTYLLTDSFRAIYAKDAVSNDSRYVDIPWSLLGLTQSYLLTGEEPPAEVTTGDESLTPEQSQGDEEASGLPAETDDATVAEEAEEAEEATEITEAIIETEPADDIADEPADETGDVAMQAEEAIVSAESTDVPEETLPESGDTAVVILPADEAETVQPTPEVTPTPVVEITPQPAPTIDPNFTLAPVVTPTPMPLSADDETIAMVLGRGLWKQLGSDGTTYYQFTADGKLLTIQVSSYTLTDGQLVSDAVTGSITLGGDSAFTLEVPSGQRVGYVLNRQGDAVAPAEFVTPSPTPPPTPTPEATPEPTPAPTPEPTPEPTPAPTPSPTPTPEPTPTLSPYVQALMVAPNLQPLADASFGNVKTLKVYSAPSPEAYRDDNAQVDTDRQVSIYGVTHDGWVLVSYPVGNGSRGRIGYIENTTLANQETVQQLDFCQIPIQLTTKANATEDPLYGQGTALKLSKGDEVILLAFMGEEWAYVETTREDKPCRVFIPQTALMTEDE